MIPSFKTVLSHYADMGCLNARVVLEHLYNRMSNDASAMTLCEPSDQYIISTCALANKIIPQYLHSKHSNEELREELLNCMIRAKDAFCSQGWSKGYPDDEDVYRKVLTYVIECVRCNLDSPKRKGESWSLRVARLLKQPVAEKQVMDVAFKFPYDNPMGFLEDSTDEELLNHLMQYIEHSSEEEEVPIVPITFDAFSAFICEHCTAIERATLLKDLTEAGYEEENLACCGLSYKYGTTELRCVAAVDIDTTPTVVSIVTQEGTKLDDYAEELLDGLLACSQTSVYLLVKCPSQWDIAFWAYQRGWTRPVFNYNKRGAAYFVLRRG